MKTNLNIKTKNTTFFEDLTYRYLPYWPLFIIFAVLFFAVAAIYIRYTTPMFETTATIMIKDEKKGVMDDELSESLHLMNAKKIVENEIVVIKSRNLIDNLVRNMALYAPVFEKGRIADRSAYITSPVMIKAVNEDQIKPTGNIVFTYDFKTKSVTLQGKPYPLNKDVLTPHGWLHFSLNPKFKEPTTRQLYFRLEDAKKVAAGIQKRLEVIPTGKLSTIVKLKYFDEVPQRGEDVLSAVIDNYNNASTDFKNNKAKNTIAFINERMNVVQRELNAVEKQIQNYKSRQGITDLGEQSRLYLQNVGDNDQKLAEINMKLAVLNQVEKYVTSKDDNAGIVPSTLGVDDPVLSGLLDKLYQAELEKEKLKKTTAENHPVMLSVDDQIQKIRPNILENIQSQRNGLVASRSNLAMTNATYNSVLQTIPQKERELLDVSRQQTIKSSIYSFLLQKREETAIASASKVPDSRVVETARASTSPSTPNKPLAFALALILSLVSCFGYVSAREVYSSKILFRSDIEQYTNEPVVAEIANFKFKEDSPLNQYLEPATGEQFRQLRIGAGIFGKLSRKKKILVTSSIGGEGKSLVSKNLAINLSHTGKKVVLINMDMHNPSKNFPTHTIGLSEYLEGEVEPYEIIKGTEHKNLFTVAAGEAQENATELLFQNKLVYLFEYLEEAFDFIILDVPAIKQVTDAYILSDHCDLTLFIVRHGYTPKSFMKRLDDTTRVTSLNNMAIVFNDVKPRGFLKNGYGYGYGINSGYQLTQRSLKRMLTSLQVSLQKPSIRKAFDPIVRLMNR